MTTRGLLVVGLFCEAFFARGMLGVGLFCGVVFTRSYPLSSVIIRYYPLLSVIPPQKKSPVRGMKQTVTVKSFYARGEFSLHFR